MNNQLTIHGTRFLLNGRHFAYTGISFFNAIYNPAFNESDAARGRWLELFSEYGINVLRIWAQWDSDLGFVDSGPHSTLYEPDGTLQDEPLERLRKILLAADERGMVIELALYARESWRTGIRLGDAESDRATAAVAEALRPHRNLALQVWNEHSHRVLEHVQTIRSVDPKRLVTNSPGYAGDLGDAKQNNALDFLTPHTSRQSDRPHWEVAAAEIRYLLRRYSKPVVDDEPARNGTPKFGGPKDATSPNDQIIQIYLVWQAGGYITYHHDMFQTGYGTPAIPPSGVPEPQFNPYHRQVLEFIAQRRRYMEHEAQPA